MAQGQTRPDKAAQGQTRPDKAAQGQTSTIFHTRKSVVSYVRHLLRGICTGCGARPDKARQGRARPDKAAQGQNKHDFSYEEVSSIIRTSFASSDLYWLWRKARQGQTRPDKARQGQTRLVTTHTHKGQTRRDKRTQGRASRDKARQGQTRPDKARQGQTRPDKPGHHTHTHRSDTPRHAETSARKPGPKGHAETPAHGAPVLDAVPVGPAASVVCLDSVDHFRSRRCRTSVCRVSRY